MSVICLAKNEVYHSRTKHIDMCYHFVKNILEDSDRRKDSHELQPNRHAYKGNVRNQVQLLQGLDLHSKMLSFVEAMYVNYGWFDPWTRVRRQPVWYSRIS